ncbi:hypothetical protein NB725_004553 [Pantoea ananatis]|nr:hypothetical protein [Pantoea ananatis]MCW0341815.1 hypothetical protein [Pantoea ananatis]MCW0351025.1 hypothetical protein [Pantoea ananatis]MCW0355730.1 hypothetical protein [Pantoea ananatis]MCW0360316.1 hypothetical protein [Pantoea ananatis]
MNINHSLIAVGCQNHESFVAMIFIKRCFAYRGKENRLPGFPVNKLRLLTLIRFSPLEPAISRYNYPAVLPERLKHPSR